MKLGKYQITTKLKNILDEALILNGRTKLWNEQMSLLGNVPELDSFSVLNVIIAIEKEFKIFIDDDEINAEIFATIASLVKFINQKLELKLNNTQKFNLQGSM